MINRLIRSAVSALLILASPGFEPYADAARIFNSKPAIPKALPTVGRPGGLPATSNPRISPSVTLAPLPASLALPPGQAGLEIEAADAGVQTPASQKEAATPAAEKSWGWGRRLFNRVTGLREILKEDAVAEPVPAASAAQPGHQSMAHGPLFSLFLPGETGVPTSIGRGLNRSGPPAPPGPKAAGGIWRKIWNAISSFWRVLPDKQRNKEYWKFISGLFVNVLAANFNLTAMADLVAQKKSDGSVDGSKLIVSRVVGLGANAASSLTTGPLVDNSSKKKIIVWTYRLRSIALMLVPIFFLGGPALAHSFVFLPAFLAIIFLNSFLAGTGTTAISVAFNSFLAKDEAYRNRANSVHDIVLGLASVAGPLLAGLFIAMTNGVLAPHLLKIFAADPMSQAFASLGGNALIFGASSLLFQALSWAFNRWLNIPEDPLAVARDGLSAWLKKEKIPGLKFKRVSMGSTEDGRPALIIETPGEPAQLSGAPAEFSGYPVRLLRKRQAAKEVLRGFRLIATDRFLLWTLLFSTIFLVAGEAMLFPALKGYLTDVLRYESTSAPFSYYLAAGSLGSTISTMFMLRSSAVAAPAATILHRVTARLRAILGRGLSPLEWQGRWSAWLNGLGMFFFWGVFFAPNLWLSVGAMFIYSLLEGPAMVVFLSLRQKVLQEKFPRDQGKIGSAMFFYQVVCSIIGLLLYLAVTSTPSGPIAAILENLGIHWAPWATTKILWAACATLSLAGILNLIMPKVVLPLQPGLKSSNGAPEQK